MNKGYIKIALALLSLAGYMQNVSFATEHVADVASDANPNRQKTIFEKYRDFVCHDIYEISAAIYHANDASALLLKLSETGTDDYSTYSQENEHKTIYFKKIGNMDIGRFHLTIPSASKYSDVIDKIWDFNHTQKYDYKFIKGDLVRIYSKYLIIFEKLNIDPNYAPPIKKYVLAAKVKQSNDTTVILCPSRVLNYLGEFDDEPNMKEILKNTQSIETDIDPEEALIKLGTNIAGFVVKKRDDNVQVIYINAIYDGGNSTEYADDKRERNRAYVNILRLEQRI
ncbi:fam-a protein [Plasmodium berghei]|uniref:Fam-a protein n=2 Tax=Plasmodium berghei TaxID=5821 RepID=A0A509AGV1_PLABA|nr:fam-a protein [Plasmodium berghei ANKA]SCL90447.1 fam-a protein [Plasmodium berghei]SCM15302.1 fam-a protein [Plasmodium berghei]SCM17097.1 fam-a protein [Plasmodium berghei]SCN22026.1 fam-a protein [Plasmodium berghei]VUC54024.1 fam-a protein [Plasmodium berghei ANKA]|eukprot:XP_034419875.1 fam-a protein [Plasmodium berghei ANKA]